MQADIVTLDAKDLLPFLKAIAPSDERARQALALLAAWDGVMDKDRPEPLIFTAFLSALHRIMLIEKTGLSLSEKGPFAADAMLSLLRDHPEWCDAPGKPDPDCHATLARALDEGLALLVQRDGADMSQWKWGHEHVAILQHNVYSHIPLLDMVSDLSVPVERAATTRSIAAAARARPPTSRSRARTAGGFRGIYDLAARPFALHDRRRPPLSTGSASGAAIRAMTPGSRGNRRCPSPAARRHRSRDLEPRGSWLRAARRGRASMGAVLARGPSEAGELHFSAAVAARP